MKIFNILRVARLFEGREIFKDNFLGRQSKKFENPCLNIFRFLIKSIGVFFEAIIIRGYLQ